MTCTEPLTSAIIFVDNKPIPASATSQTGVYQASIPIAHSGKYQVQLRSTVRCVGYFFA